MNILSLGSFFAFLVYLGLGFMVYRADRNSVANRLFLFFCLCLAIWSFGYTFIYVYSDLSSPTYWFWNKLAALGWCTYSSLALHLSLGLVGSAKKIKKWHYLLIYGPSIVALLFVLFVLSAEYHPVKALNMFSILYSLYYPVNIIASLVVIWLWGNRSHLRREKKYAQIIILCSGLTLFLGFTTQTVLYTIDPDLFPPIAQIFALIWACGIGYAILKYKFMNVTALVNNQQILAEINDFFIIVDIKFNIVQLNRRLELLLELDRKSLLGSSFSKLIAGDLAQTAFFKDLPKHMDLCLLNKDGHPIPIRVFINYVKDIVDDPVGILLVGQDLRLTRKLEEEITERLYMEKVLQQLSFHDSLTGLLNRTYFEEEMQRIQDKQIALGLVIIDVDGLKLINDTLGHAIGDQLIITTSEALKKCVGKGGIIARIGGDEFAVLMEDTTKENVMLLAKKIRDEAISFALIEADFNISLSVGSSYSRKLVSKEELFKQADDSMYNEKLFKGNNSRRVIIKTLTDSLQTRDYLSEGHADRLQDFITRMAKSLQLPDSNMNKLRLFAQYHDLGKVGIPDSILFKPGLLTNKEIKIMQKHPEIGYRIALSAPELMPIADWILKHHEWWNGSGYPLGLKELDIPLECRLLSITDAYDEMVNDRPYRNAMRSEEALQKIQEGAGSQYDPELCELFLTFFTNSKVR